MNIPIIDIIIIDSTSAQGAGESYLTVFPVKFAVARIALLLIQIAVLDRTTYIAVNMRSRYASIEILSAQMVGARRATIPKSEAFRTRHEVPRVKKLRWTLSLLSPGVQVI